ncbi:MAG: DUF2207 domain-containing protein [Pseudomonadales bacterium]
MTTRYFRRPIAILACLAGLCSGGAGAIAAERILDYHSEITVAADGTMVVDEHIRVRAEGEQIRRGIYRDFPTSYRDAYGNHYEVDFQVLSVQRDGQPEPWHSESRSNGVRVYVGDANHLLSPGNYSYRIRYHTDRQLGFFEDHDELYWNVTGNGWGFPIDTVSAAVRLPVTLPADELTIEGYTGPFGSQGRDYVTARENGEAVIRTTRGLSGGEGLTLVVGWPKGIVAEPDLLDRLGYLLKDNLGLLLALITLVMSAVYLLREWRHYGRDPEPGVIFAHYEPPEGYSPASARYISKMGYDSKALSAAVINLAVKGYVTIIKSGGDFQLKREHESRANASSEPLAPGEAVLYDRLFASGSLLELDDKNHRTIGAAKSAHERALKRDYLNRYFKLNTMKVLPTLLLSIGIAVMVGVLGDFTPLAAVAFLLTAILHGVFFWLMRAPTPRGRLLMDKLEGFKLYLEVAEKDDLNLRHPPDLTPALFERYLPFAIALGVEQAWAEQFARVFAQLAREQGQAYRPLWYHGSFDSHRLSSFTRDVGSSFSSAISSASTPPGSSSGGGGGGSSGGGGGGGGGGGW